MRLSLPNIERRRVIKRRLSALVAPKQASIQTDLHLDAEQKHKRVRNGFQSQSGIDLLGDGLVIRSAS
jgi:hypothetical protein